MEALRLSKFLSYKFSYKFEDFFSYLGVKCRNDVGALLFINKHLFASFCHYHPYFPCNFCNLFLFLLEQLPT